MLGTDLCEWIFESRIYGDFCNLLHCYKKTPNQQPKKHLKTPTNKQTLNYLALLNEGFYPAKGIWKSGLSHWVGF